MLLFYQSESNSGLEINSLILFNFIALKNFYYIVRKNRNKNKIITFSKISELMCYRTIKLFSWSIIGHLRRFRIP